jgi:hypothetical protein
MFARAGFQVNAVFSQVSLTAIRFENFAGPGRPAAAVLGIEYS